MRFGKIEYLNLLPFHVFMKRYVGFSGAKMALEYKKGVPSKINMEFKNRRVDAAFISSIRAKKSSHVDLGIIAKKEVLSVLVVPSETQKDDVASETSNTLSKILNIKGEVLIGDRALRAYLSGIEAVDLAHMWHKKYNLPFVFALLCHHKHIKQIEKLSRNFLKQKVKIPRYILQKASKNTQIKESDILHYLDHISYKLDHKSNKALKKFWKLTDNLSL
jgi:chorismate dehydratase